MQRSLKEKFFQRDVLGNKALSYLFDIKPIKRNKVKGVNLYGEKFTFHHASAFVDTYEEIFIKGIYNFNCMSEIPYIIDCGANMGLSVLFFSLLYPKAKIEAFEPESDIFDILYENKANYGMPNVTLSKKAVWDNDCTLEFIPDAGMGGKVGFQDAGAKLYKVEAVRLKNLLNKTVDFLKIDIEGAELQVLRDCSDSLHFVQHLFVEYHSYLDKQQSMDELLTILTKAGFRYHIKESFTSEQPFVKRRLSGATMDMAINIFAFRD